ncbi:6,7-dimethyl-8-ribityllumazine synthase [Panacibacter ginsenosidivorans]|uniref:6,7-dimethyl-8-ribityllumazine synthase n=1 Tax=Panacibacter ginsenosidivorans TaxID=1813871 RepID=A0A5B8V3Z7_9BACT|nr:6,7-dimethyl-8-ribityllumazine synthase [Panacibacter ginsenosidivorans]QEC65899.1 6,7-dimethyl-8-ribityllumazine synthase [Panacibacter ginsenosidivorans]
MTTKGNNALNKGIPQLKDAFVVIVKTEWNAPIVNKLEAGAKKVLNKSGISFKVLTVPGAVEIPFIIKQYAESIQTPADAFIALGTVIRGDTPHFDYVCKAITDGVLSLNMMLEVPTIFGVLTVNDEQQAKERVGGKHGHKGEEAAITAIKMIKLNRSLNK